LSRGLVCEGGEGRKRVSGEIELLGAEARDFAGCNRDESAGVEDTPAAQPSARESPWPARVLKHVAKLGSGAPQGS
jgi:hypothetical protein